MKINLDYKLATLKIASLRQCGVLNLMVNAEFAMITSPNTDFCAFVVFLNIISDRMHLMSRIVKCSF